MNSKHTIDIKNRYTEPADAPNGCDIKVPSGQPVYITGTTAGTTSGIMDAVDAFDISLNASWDDLRKNCPDTIDAPDRECGSIALKDGIHRVFITFSGNMYVDGRIY